MCRRWWAPTTIPPTEIHDKVRRNEGAPWFAVSPLMHAAGLWTVFSGTLAGLPVVLYDDRTKFDPPLVWRTAEREKVGMMTMVGDAYAAPLVEELNRTGYELSSLYAIGTGGAATNPKHVSALLEKLPQLTIINGYGSSETGNMGFGHNRRGSHRETFDLREGGAVVSDDMTRFVEPGEPEVGWVVRTGRIPLGYFDDADATRKTFPVVDGKRVVVSGDRASLEADGTLRLYGRDSLVINTGGEKVFVEEVEAILRACPESSTHWWSGGKATDGDRRSWHSWKPVRMRRSTRSHCTRRASRASPGSRRPRSSSSSTRCADSATARPTTGGPRVPKRHSGPLT